jgi:intracellular multiplication protein IcmD
MEKRSNRKMIKVVSLLVASSAFLYAGFALAQATDIGGVASTITATFGNLAKLITGVSYIAGLGFAVAAILKFKAHRDNPQQVTVGTPIALLFVAAALLYLPSLFTVAGNTIFGTGKSTATVSGSSCIS